MEAYKTLEGARRVFYIEPGDSEEVVIATIKEAFENTYAEDFNGDKLEDKSTKG